MIILLVISFISTFIYTFVTLRSFFKARAVTGFLVCAAMYDVVYGIFPLCVFFQVAIGNRDIISALRMIDFSQEGVLALIYHYLYALCGFFAIFLSYYGRIRKNKIQQQYALEQPYVSEKAISNQATYLTAWTCLIIGAVSMLLWSFAYGSIFQLIQQANRVRSGYGLVSNSLAFFKHPTKVLLVTSYLFLSLYIKAERNRPVSSRKILTFIGLVCSLLLSYLYLMANDGRLTIVLFALGLFWLCCSSGKKINRPGRSLITFIFLIVLALILLIKMDDITYYLRYGMLPVRSSNKDLFSSIIGELSFLPLGGQVSILSAWHDKISVTVFDDLVTGIFAWLPTPYKPQGIEDVWNINTKLIYGDLSVLHGQAPCGIITQGYYDMRFIGILLVCIALGLALKKFDKTDQADWTVMRYAIGAEELLILIRCVPYFSLYDIVLGLFPILIMILVYQVWKSILYTIEKRR